MPGGGKADARFLTTQSRLRRVGNFQTKLIFQPEPYLDWRVLLTELYFDSETGLCYHIHSTWRLRFQATLFREFMP